MSSNVKVGIKLSPLIKCEKDENLSIQWVVKENSIISLHQETKKWDSNVFHFDYCFDENTNNALIFDSIIKSIVDGTIDGINGTIFCYGQFNSGKTHTMIGTPEDPGIIPLTINYIFNVISNIIKREFLLRVSYLEICDEKINDLLNTNQVDLQLYSDDNEQIIVDCKEEIINSSDNMLSIMEKGIKNKKIKENNKNKQINGHKIFRIIIESQEVEGDSSNTVQVSQLNLVELIGFKKVYYPDIVDEHHTDISLSALESIIAQISNSQNIQEHIDYDYHNSKLTEFLQTSLSGNALIAIVCTVLPVALEETYCTLSFASQAKDVKTKPQKNEVISDSSLLIRYAKQLTKLQIELERIKNGNSSVEEVESNKLQQKYQINHLLEERIKLLKTQIISGCTKNCEEPFICKSRRRKIWYNPGTFKQYLPVFHTQTCLPTIKEISSEIPQKKNIMQSVDIINQTFQTAFTDFELELIDSETDYSIKENEHVKCMKNESDIESKNDNFLLIPAKKESPQISSNEVSASTPKGILRKYILDLTRDLTELREFTTLEKQLICEENHCCTNNLKQQMTKQFICSGVKNNEIDDYYTHLIIRLEEEKAKLLEDLEIKTQELNHIKSSIQSFKLDIEKLQETIYLLSNENIEMSNKLSTEKEHSKQAELHLQKTIDTLYERISKITAEKINLESDRMSLNDKLEFFRSKSLVEYNEEQLLNKYQNEIDSLKTENIELSSVIAEKDRELENIKESKSLLYNHDCIYKDKVILLTENNKCLVTENNELSSDLIDKIEKNDMLKEQCDILKNKMSMIQNTNSDENDIEQLRSENNILKAEIVELKMKVTVLTDENVKFSNNLLESIDNFDHSHNEKANNDAIISKLSAVSDNSIKTNETGKKILQEENYEDLSNKVIMLQDEVAHLSRLNKKLSDLKLSSCSQCIHLKNLNESRRALKLQAKALNHKLEDLQKKFDRKCVDTEILKLKVHQELNVSFTDASLNASFIDGMNVSLVEEKVQYLSNELHTLKDDHDKLSVLYKEKCDELEKLHDEVSDAKNTDDSYKSKKHIFKNETKIERVQKSIDQVKEDIDEIKKNIAPMFRKLQTERVSLLDEISILKDTNEELQEKVLDKEMSKTIALEKVQILENELSNMNKEIEQFSMKEKIMRTEKLTLEVELEDLKAEKRNKDILITTLSQKINDLNECISSLKYELDLITNEKNELSTSNEKIEYEYKNKLELLRKQYNELEREKQISAEIEQRAILWAKEIKTNVNKLETGLRKQENIYEELDTVKECMIKELKSLKSEVHSVDILNKTAKEIFTIFLQALMLKEEEIIKKMRELFEKDKQEIEDKRQQSADAEKRVMLWAKELETEIEKLQIDLTQKESLCKEQQNKSYQLDHLLTESNYEKKILKEKIEVLEIDFNNLQTEFNKQCKVDIQQKGEAFIVAQKREEEVQEAFKHKEIELESKMKSEIESYEKKIEEIMCTLEIYKTKNMELKNNIEGLEVNEKQLKNIVEANYSELKMKQQIIQKITLDFEQLTEVYNKVNDEVQQKTIQIENITALLKNKSDMFLENKAKLETIIPDYEMLQNQVKERKENKLDLEEIKNVGLNKQLNELNNKNIALIEEIDELKEKFAELQKVNIKLEKKIRNSVSKMKVETEIEELKDENKRLQNNLVGATNRVSELQESKNKTFLELVNLQGQYELLSKENAEIKKTLYRSKQSTSYPCKEDAQKDKEIVEYVNRIKDLFPIKKEFENHLEECKTYIQQNENSIENEKICEILRKKICELELQLVSKNGQIATLEIQIQSENFPYQRKCKELEELLLTFRKKNAELNSEMRKLQRTLNDINAWDCDICRRWRINRRSQACQTTFDNASNFFTVNNEIIEDHVKIMKLEKEKTLIKDICRARCRQIKHLEDRVRELEEAQSTSYSKCVEFLKEKSDEITTSTIHFTK
ncbi:PREDICTED: kinesin-like protein KIN-7I [Eufriesea mexicana]|uniref:kinesin-like protein KIN-7I n=1 Tax=Eufriesea mexicana TaxID=516756 RepID=UPI00083C5E48|nr:PREDICTED: kinesin-like protein KIN-7I [Eufriesea mexicana]